MNVQKAAQEIVEMVLTNPKLRDDNETSVKVI